MNLICNDCVGARIYEQLGIQFANPFTWSLFAYDYYENLIKNYNRLNFNNIEIIKQKYRKSRPESYGIIIDHLVKCFYIHHHQDSLCVMPKKIGIDLFAHDIKTYIENMYRRRLSRMLDQPIFIYHSCDINDVRRFLLLKTAYKKILLTHSNKFNQLPNNNTEIAVLLQHKTTASAAQEFLVKYKKMLYTYK